MKGKDRKKVYTLLYITRTKKGKFQEGKYRNFHFVFRLSLPPRKVLFISVSGETWFFTDCQWIATSTLRTF